MNKNEFTFDDLRSRIYNFIEKAKIAKEDIVFEFKIDEKLAEIKLSSIVGINIYRTIQEAINNAIKYAEAQNIFVDVQKTDNQIKIVIKDDGKGFDQNKVEVGNGLQNMKKRIEEIEGSFKIQSEINSGTIITLIIV
jgi:signal transduction histidine kinase